MHNTEFFELFYSKLEKEIKDEDFINSIKELIENDEFTEKNYDMIFEELAKKDINLPMEI